MTTTENIYKAKCIACGFSTLDAKVIRILLEVDGTCPACDDGGVYFYDTEDGDA